MAAVPVSCHDGDTFADFTVRAGDRVPLVMSWAPGHEPEIPQVDPELALSATTGITATAGSVTPPTRCRRCSRPASGARPARGASGCCGPSRASRRHCRSCTAWTARRLPEAELPWLDGYQGSSPVRTGNAASDQLQLDVWGETLDALFLARQVGLPADPDAWALQVALMNYLESAWTEPDNGLWEVRGDRQHFTHSKVMAWAAADRMARSVRTYGLPGPAPRWEQLRDQIHHDVVNLAFGARR